VRFDPIVHYRKLAGLDGKGAAWDSSNKKQKGVKSHREKSSFLFSDVFFKN
jgi:hypothetical protein